MRVGYRLPSGVRVHGIGCAHAGVDMDARTIAVGLGHSLQCEVSEAKRAGAFKLQREFGVTQQYGYSHTINRLELNGKLGQNF